MRTLSFGGPEETRTRDARGAAPAKEGLAVRERGYEPEGLARTVEPFARTGAAEPRARAMPLEAVHRCARERAAS